MNQYRPNFGMPPVVKTILTINVGIFLLIHLCSSLFHIDIVSFLALHLPGSPNFHLYQFISHMFTQEGLFHLFFNMFAIFMFGRILESVWGSKRFLLYYFATGLGAALLHMGVSLWELHGLQVQYQQFVDTPDAGLFADFLRRTVGGISADANRVLEGINSGSPEDIYTAKAFYERIITRNLNIGTVGASGAVFGLLLAFGMLFPNTELYLMFIPIPIKAKYFVLGYGALELYMGMQNRVGDNVAHFAHLGGMLFGYFLVRYWKKHSKRFY